MLRFLIPLALLLAIDLYAYQAFRTIWGNTALTGYIYWGIHIALYLVSFALLFMRADIPTPFLTLFGSIMLAIYVPKLLIIVVLVVEDVSRLFRWMYGQFAGTAPPSGDPAGHISRSRFLSQLAVFAAGVPFAGMLYGILKGKYDYQVRRVQVPIENLPDSFNGLTITQISDIHTGSFEDKDAVQRGIDLINEQASDLIFFTGDLINTYIDEVEGFEDMYAQLRAKEGVFSILGNHDYGDYASWPNPEAKREHFERVLDTHKTFGWRLLKNENHLLQRGTDSLAIIGTENWSSHLRFPKYGKIDEAVKGTEGATVKLLLSHDPSHWDGQIRENYPDIDVMFSGHTHGFQFGIEIPGFRWSPVQYLYKQWGGLYQQGKQFLYVNRGFGFLGFSGRLGMRPEITVIELVNA